MPRGLLLDRVWDSADEPSRLRRSGHSGMRPPADRCSTAAANPRHVPGCSSLPPMRCPFAGQVRLLRDADAPALRMDNALEEVMSIRARVEDSLLLWNSGRLEGAFLNALIAVAGTARRRYPKRGPGEDREAFVGFLKSAHSVRISVEYRGECLPVEFIFYKWIRCELVHEGELPVDIEFLPDSEPGSFTVRA